MTKPVLDLPKVELSPPGERTAGSSSLTLRAAISVALLVGVFVLAFLLVAGGIVLNVVVYRNGRIVPVLVLGTLAIVLALGRALFAAVRAPDEPVDEIVVSAADEPGLHDEVRDLARAVGTRIPDRVVLVASTNAYVREFGPMLGLLRGTRTLAIGTPLLDTLTVSQLRAVLAHELGHLAGGDTRLGPVAYRTQQVLAHLVQNLGSSAAGRLFEAYWHLQYRVSASVRRGQELVADRAAVRVAGRQEAADALQRVEATSIAENLFQQAYLGPLLQSGHRPVALRSGFTSVIDARAELLRTAVGEAHPEEDPYASHPSTPVRIERVAELPETHEGPADDRAARTLLQRPDHWIEVVDQHWLHLILNGQTLPAVEWAEWPRLVVADSQSERAAVVESVLNRLGLPDGLDGLEEAIASERRGDLAAGLVQAGWRTGTADERHVVLTTAVEAVAAATAVESGDYEWQLSWAGPVALRSPRGATVDLSVLADEAVKGDWAPLRRQLEFSDPTPARPVAPSTTEPAAPVAPPQDLPPAPSPPYAERRRGVWAAELPGRLGRKVAIVIGPDAVVFDGEEFAYDAIEHVTVSVSGPETSGFTATVELSDLHRSRKARMSAASAKGGQPIAAAVDHLWSVMRVAVAPRIAAEISDAIAAGDRRVVGGAEFDQRGVTTSGRKGQHIPWHDVADAYVSERSIVIPRFSGKGVSVPLNKADTFLLLEAIPQLRARFAGGDGEPKPTPRAATTSADASSRSPRRRSAPLRAE